MIQVSECSIHSHRCRPWNRTTNKAMQILGGIKGITNNQRALEEYFLTAGQISCIIEDFSKLFYIKENDGSKKDEHYQLRGSKNARIMVNVTKLTNAFENFGVTFDNTESLVNVLTNKVMPAESVLKFLSVKEIGSERYNNFVSQQLNGETSIWETIKKEKLPTFESLNKKITVKVNKKTVSIKEERKLMSRFVIASRTRQDIDLSHYFGEYEFSVVPRVLFTTDGSLHPTTDKSVIAKELRNICHIDTNDMIIEGHQEYKAIVFDGMAVVNRINIKKAKIKNCRVFATTFTNIIFCESDGFE